MGANLWWIIAALRAGKTANCYCHIAPRFCRMDEGRSDREVVRTVDGKQR